MADQPVAEGTLTSHPFTVHEAAKDSHIAECAWGMEPGATRAVCGQSRLAKRHAGRGVVVLRDEPLTVEVGRDATLRVAVSPAEGSAAGKSASFVLGAGGDGNSGSFVRAGGGGNFGAVSGAGGSGGMMSLPPYSPGWDNRKPVSMSDMIPAVQAWDAMSAQVRDTIIRKSRGYGDAWVRQGYMGNLARVLSKTARLQSMMWRDDKDGYLRDESGESIQDTAVDLVALCAFFIANFEEDNRWGR